jgi:hypothetical protein
MSSSMNDSTHTSHPVNGSVRSSFSDGNGVVWGSDLPIVVERATTDDERARLEAELVQLQSRADAARKRLADLDLRPALTVEVEASIMTADAMEREHEKRVAFIRESARIEIERILVEARAASARRLEPDEFPPLGDDDV